MHNRFDPHVIAARLRGLMSNDLLNVEKAARNLGVSEVALRMSVDELSPHPALEVIVAVVRWYGVDPTWIITGEYDVDTHRALLDGESESDDLPSDIALLIAQHIPPPLSGPERPLSA